MKQPKQRYGVSSDEAFIGNNLLVDFDLSSGYVEMINGKCVWKGRLESSAVVLEW